MAILQITQSSTGLEGVLPRIVHINSNDSFATITAAGWLNEAMREGLYSPLPSDMLLVSYLSGSTVISQYFTISISGGIVTINPTGGDVVLPTVVNHIMVSTDTVGTIGNLTGVAINDGSIQAGRDSGGAVAGNLISFPTTTANGRLIVSALNAGGAFDTTIRNSIMGQSSVISIPDPGAATGRFLLSALAAAGTQHITSGSLQIDAGGLLAGLAAGGTAGSVTLFPTTTANGSFVFSPVNAGGAFNTTISNGVMGQSTVYTIPDAVNAVGRFLVGATATPFTSGNFPVASGTGGLMVDSGLAAANIQNKTNIKAATTGNIGAGGAGPISVVVAGLTAASIVVGTIESSSNAVQVQTITATATGFDVTFSGDPGASCLLNYIAFIAAQ